MASIRKSLILHPVIMVSLNENELLELYKNYEIKHIKKDNPGTHSRDDRKVFVTTAMPLNYKGKVYVCYEGLVIGRFDSNGTIDIFRSRYNDDGEMTIFRPLKVDIKEEDWCKRRKTIKANSMTFQKEIEYLFGISLNELKSSLISENDCNQIMSIAHLEMFESPHSISEFYKCAEPICLDYVGSECKGSNCKYFNAINGKKHNGCGRDCKYCINTQLIYTPKEGSYCWCYDLMYSKNWNEKYINAKKIKKVN